MISSRLFGCAVALTVVVGVACDDEASVPATPSAEAPRSSAAPVEAEPAGCAASGKNPKKIASVPGDVYGFVSGPRKLYYTSWQYITGSGGVGWIRKDGEGRRALASLKLEPRGLTIDARNIYYTAGIRLMAIPLDGSDETVLDKQFSSKSIVFHDAHVYGVPGDYGPYDRVAKIEVATGKTVELTSGKRHKVKDGPTGWARIASDEKALYFTDAGGNRVLSLPFDGEKPNVVVSGVKQPLGLALGAATVYFSLARAGELMSVPKGGGTATKLAAGLIDDSHIAGDDQGLYAVFKGRNDDAPVKLSAVSIEDGNVTPIATVEKNQTIDAMAVDADCVYWAVRIDSSKTLVYARRR